MKTGAVNSERHKITTNIWSIQPKYLDAKSLVTLWREGLLAQHVLLGRTKGYKHHPQLIRFKRAPDAKVAIANYLDYVADEADNRNYRFNRAKIANHAKCDKLPVNQGQLEYQHLLAKLKIRDPSRYNPLKPLKAIQAHPLFTQVDGGVEAWEVMD